jgi:uncharacterized membrane protein YfcA
MMQSATEVTSMIDLAAQLKSISMPETTVVVTLAAIFAGSLVSGLAGFAFSAIAGSILMHWLPPTQVVPLLLACSIAGQLFGIAKLWRVMAWRQCAPFLVGGLAGIPLGGAILSGLDARIFAVTFGCFLVCYSAYMLARPKIVVARGGWLGDVAAGFAGGITGGAIAFPSAVPTVWCGLRGLPKQEQRGIIQPFILLMQIATLAWFAKLGVFAATTVSTFLWCVPAVLAGSWIGLRLFDRIDDRRFRCIVLVLLIVSGAGFVL